MSGFRTTQMLRAVTELRIPDRVAQGPRAADDLAEEAGVQAEPLRRVLRCLASVGVFAETEDGRFSATPTSDCFRDQPGSLRGMALLLPTDSYVAFADLMHTMKTGEPAFEHVFQMTRWAQLAKEPEKAKVFNAAMQFSTERSRGPIASAYDFQGLQSVIDVGGGRGTLIAAILKAHPHLRGAVFDLEAGLAETDAYLKQEGVRDRCEIVSGSFFESLPSGYDAYFLKSVIHDWSDEKSIEILATCRKAMGHGARVVVAEQMLPARAQVSPESNRVFMDDVQMLVMLGGRERTEAEFAALMDAAGLRLSRVIPTDSRFHLIEGGARLVLPLQGEGIAQ